jgi:hypothetical protein
MNMNTPRQDKPRFAGVIVQLNQDSETGYIERRTGADLLFRAESLIGLPWGNSLLDMPVSFEVGKRAGREIAYNVEARD